MMQKEMILKHMQMHGGITAAEAMEKYGIYRLSARILNLRKDGVQIISEQKKSRNRYGKAVRYDCYKLESGYEGQHNDVQNTV